MTMMKARNPYTGEFDYPFETASLEEIERTCEKLRHNQAAWYQLGVAGRLAVLGDFVKAIARNYKKVYTAICADTGRAMIAAAETVFIETTMQRLATEASVLQDPEPRPSLSNPAIIGHGQYVPLGLVGNIAPWNYPIVLSFLDTLPALVAGNAVVIKPSTVTPRYADALTQVLEEVPELHDVLAFLQGSGSLVGQAIIDHVDCICMTGSTQVGKQVAAAAGQRFIPAFLELGGNDPALVLPSADLDRATDTILWSAVRACGQTCSALERVYAPIARFEEFVDLLVEKARKIQTNYPDMERGGIGPFIQESQAQSVKAQLDEAVSKGARILCGGQIIDHGGKWMLPTVVVKVDHSMKLMTEETFGPVVPVMPYETLEEAVDRANDTTYGLSAAIFAGTVDEALPLARQLNAGCVGINDASLQSAVHDVPHVSFGLSGLGQSRFGPEGILRFTRRKAIIANTIGKKSLQSYHEMLAGLRNKILA